MFGHHDDKPKDDQIPDESIQAAMDDSQYPHTVADPDAGTDGQPATSTDTNWQHPGTPLDSNTPPQPISDVISPAGGSPRPLDSQLQAPSFGSPSRPTEPTTAPLPSLDTPAADDNHAHDLIGIKQHALNELEPLIDQLDQTPEERFRTLMMMIQASDDRDLIEPAYEAAHSIEDEKQRAQALLDIINEINYFTQQASAEA